MVQFTRMATIVLALAALCSASPASAEENPQDSTSERKAKVWRVTYRTVAERYEAPLWNPLLAWAMAMKKKAEAERRRHTPATPQAPPPPVDPEAEQMTIDK